MAQILTLAGVKAAALLAIQNGTLQATKAQTDPDFRGPGYNVHRKDPKVNCVIGVSLSDKIKDDPQNKISSIGFLIEECLVETEDKEALMELQCLHDLACITVESSRSDNYKQLLKALEE